MIYVIGPRDKAPEGALVIDTTSRSKSIFSPFYNPTDYPIQAKNMENAWQYSKVYEGHDLNGEPSIEWHRWRAKGLESKWADRYPMGKGKVPLYSWFDGKKLTYVEARKKLYVPLYKNSIATDRHEDQILHIANLLNEKYRDVALWDFDGYLTTDSFETIVNNPKKKMGHAFVLREVIQEYMK